MFLTGFDTKNFSTHLKAKGNNLWSTFYEMEKPDQCLKLVSSYFVWRFFL